MELLLDLHGHSSRMNTFFYANSFGKNNLLFPAVAARTLSYLDLADCSLADDALDRAATARVALGSLIR